MHTACIQGRVCVGGCVCEGCEWEVRGCKGKAVYACKLCLRERACTGVGVGAVRMHVCVQGAAPACAGRAARRAVTQRLADRSCLSSGGR